VRNIKDAIIGVTLINSFLLTLLMSYMVIRAFLHPSKSFIVEIAHFHPIIEPVSDIISLIFMGVVSILALIIFFKENNNEKNN